MKQIYAIFIGLLLGACLASCYDDKGNYDYHWVQDIYTDGILTDTTVARNGVLKKEVDLQKIVLQTETETETETADPEDYTYEWKAIARAEDNSLSADVVLGTEKDLNDTINLPQGSYQINYSVTEKNSGVTWITYFRLTVVNEYSGGYIFLTEDAEQNVEMELWAIVPSQEERVHETGVLANAGYPYTHGGANIVKNVTGLSSMNGIWIATGENTGWLDLPDFTWEETNLMSMYMLVQEEEDYNVKNIAINTYDRALLLYSASGAIHISPFQQEILSTTMTYVDGMEFAAAPYYGGTLNQSAMIVYDQTAKRFVSYEFAMAAWNRVNAECYETTDVEDALEGYDLVNMSDHENTPVAVVKDSEGNYFVCNFGIRDNANGAPEGYITSQYQIEENTSTLENASYNIIDKANGFFYWSQGNKIYVSYHPSANVSECVEVTLQDEEGNPIALTDEIVSLTTNGNTICIATYSEANKGMVYMASSNSQDSRKLTISESFASINPVKSVTTW